MRARPQLDRVSSWSNVQIGSPRRGTLLIGLVVSCGVNCRPGLQVMCEPSGEQRAMAALPEVHCLPLTLLQTSVMYWSNRVNAAFSAPLFCLWHCLNETIVFSLSVVHFFSWRLTLKNVSEIYYYCYYDHYDYNDNVVIVYYILW